MKKNIFQFMMLLSVINLYAQQNPSVISLSNNDNGQKVYNAQAEINFNPGYIFTDVNGGMNAFIEGPNYYGNSFTNNTFSQVQIDQNLNIGKIDGSYSISPSGGVNYSIPIKVPFATGGMQPNLSINYNSQQGNGLLGYGWDLAGLSSISLVSNNWYLDGKSENIKVDGTDKFAWDGSRLFVNTGLYGANNSTYGTEIESYNKIISYGNGTTPDWFKILTKEGITMEFGNTPDSKFIGSNGKVVSWRISKIYDLSGNYMDFQYFNGDGEIKIERISYGGNSVVGTSHYNRIEFNYATRDDNNELYFAFSKVTSKHLLTSIRIFSENNNFKSYDLEYYKDNFSYLKTVKEGGSNLQKLNSTSFKYGEKGIEFVTDYCSNFNGLSADVIAAKDFNGDGKSDLLLNKFYYNTAGTKIYNQWEAMIATSENNFSHYASGVIPIGYSIYNYDNSNGISSGFSSTFDFRGDGRSDVLLVNTTFDGSVFRLYGFQIINITGLDQSTIYTPTIFPVGHKVIPEKYLHVGDFDGDGKDDIIYMPIDANQEFYGWMLSDEYGEVSLNLNGLKYLNATDNISHTDIDGDGKMEIMATFTWNSTEFFEFEKSTNNIHVANRIYYSSFPPAGSKVYVGDFNGDQKTDLLCSINGVNSWTIGYAQGNGFNQKTFTFLQNPYLNSSSNTIQVLDLNLDGYSDIIHAFNNWSGNTSTSSSITTYYSSGLKFQNATYTTDLITNHNDFVQGDFNGDGNLELLNRDYYGSNAMIYKFKKNGQENTLVSIKDGFLNETKFTYTTLATGLNYTPGSVSTIPVYDAGRPLKVVYSVFEPDGLGAFNQINYSYSGAKWHGRGKGFLCYSTINIKDISNNTTKILINNIKYNSSINLGLVYTELNEEIIKKTSNNSILSDKTFVYQSSSVATNQLRYKLNLVNSTEINNLTTVTKTVNNTYDSNGNLTNSVEANGAETITKSNIYVSFGTWWIPSRVSNSTTTITRIGDQLFSRSIAYSYDPKGKVLTQISDPSLAKSVTNTFTYDNFGNVIKTSISSAGLPTKNIEITFDVLGRFALTTKNELNQITYREVERLWGNPTKITDVTGLISTFSYDNFGNLISSTNTRGLSSNVSFGWDITNGGISSLVPNNTLYFKLSTTAGEPYEKIWYDCRGREVKKEVQTLTNPVFIVKKYDNKGNQISKTDPFYSNSTPIVYINSYDEFNRIIQTTNGTSTSNYSYSANGGNSNVTIQTPNGTTSKKIDQSGKVIQSTDEGGILIFNYFSNGELKSTSTNGQMLVQNEYDTYGRQSKLTDIDAGVTLYEYNAYNQLISQTDANNVTYTMQYDVVGRLVSKTGPEGTTVSNYITSGNGLNQLSQLIGPNGVNINYTYDQFGRVIDESKIVDGLTYTTSLTYNINDDINSMTYPSGFKIFNSYNLGILQSVYINKFTTPIYQLPTYNQRGQLTSYKLGNGLVSSNTFDNFGMPTNFSTPGIQNFDLSFNITNGLLEYRRDNLKNRVEDFIYDNVNRLTESKVHFNSSQLTYLPTDITYSSNGNIQNKSDVGNYVYDNSKIHAVVQVDNANQVIPSLTQNIVYAPFDRVQSISEGTKSLNFTYDPDLNRIKTVLTNNGTVIQTKYFIGNYEKIVTPTGIKEIHYIPTGNGTDAVYILENGVGTYYYLYKDHIGSIVSVTNASASIVYEQNFDAWGKRRSATDWNSSPVLNSNFSWLRGFTGHEHLDEFGLINMNNRLYDPVIGRMCGVDNFVQNPYFTQNYNRYSYVYNNPLSFTDPNGEWVQMVVGMAIGMVEGGIIAHNKGYTERDWQFYGYILGGGVVGAVSGGVGEAVVAGGGFMSQTAGIMVSSYINSYGMAALRGSGSVGISFGVANFDLTNSEWGYIGKKGNSSLENMGYLFGGLANLQDVVAGFNGTNIEVWARKKLAGHSELKGDNISISVGPVYGPEITSKSNDLLWEAQFIYKWPAARNQSFINEFDPHFMLKLNNVNEKLLSKMQKNIEGGKNLLGFGNFKYGIGRGCVNYTSRALLFSGVININAFLPITSPILLNAELYLRQIGIYSSPYLRNF